MDAVILVVVIVLALLCLLSLLLNFAVVRRLRDVELRLARATGPDSGNPMSVPTGRKVPDVSFADVEGTKHRSRDLAPTLYGFFGPQCSVCHEKLPGFLETAAGHHGSVVSVVVRDGGDTAELVHKLTPAGVVVVEDLGGTLTNALQVAAFPTFVVSDHAHTVVSSGYELPQSVA